MIRKKKTCKCGCKREGFIWSQGMLKECFLRLNPSKKIAYKSAKQKIKDVEKKNRTIKLHEWFLELFDKHCLEDENGKYVICFESGKKLYEKYYSIIQVFIITFQKKADIQSMNSKNGILFF